ncbi:hypothetical protein HanRHA438_Chr02g0053671 [Helianthus annuus]|nr:hypothetical protein HanRHA438_Chr02g0053671 [Helianthus annuus]
MWWFTLIKYFLTTVLMKIFRCQIRQYAIPPKLAHGRPFLCLYKGSGVVTRERDLRILFSVRYFEEKPED